MKKFRSNGALGALLDEYEKVVSELKSLISPYAIEELQQCRDKTTTDPDCTSIESVLAHVISSGFNYCIAIQNHLGIAHARKDRVIYSTTDAYLLALDEMFLYNESYLMTLDSSIITEFDNNKKFKTPWGQSFDIEQILQHAIVHILRHRRQIEKFVAN